MHRFLPIFLLCLAFASVSSVEAQIPESIEIKTEHFSVTFTNLHWATANKTEPKPGSSFNQPVDPQPLDSSKLYPPGTMVWLYFDYKLNLEESDAPSNPSKIWLTLGSAGGEDRLGNLPTELQGTEGTNFIGLLFSMPQMGSISRTNADLDLKFILYGTQKDNQPLPQTLSDKTIKLKASIDGIAVISESQFEAIKDMYKRLQQLEKRVAELEKAIKPHTANDGETVK